MSTFYPLWLDVKGRLCLVVGGGRVAERKAASLMDCQARVLVISPEISPALEEQWRSGAIEVRKRGFASGDVEGAWLVFAAAGDRQVNQQIAEACQAAGIPVNVADAPESGSFLVPALMRRGALGGAGSTEGASPLMAQRLRDALLEALGPEYGDFVDWLAEQRRLVQSGETNLDKRRQAYEAALEGLAFDFKGAHADEYKERIRACISCYRA